jgi:DNA (cytosine-5)-methyltransferase 1
MGWTLDDLVAEVIYGSVCSGIEAATVAWHPLGWKPAFFSEIEPFPKKVLAHHYPNVPDLGDMTKIGESSGPIDILVGGTPCQSYSLSGLRAGLSDPRGSLMLSFGLLAQKLQARWIVWENVPGVLSSNGGRDFGTYLGMLAELGYGFAYRVLDSRYFGVAQNRRRTFLVGHAGADWERPARVLFERESLLGNTKEGGENREGFARRVPRRTGARKWPAERAPTLNASFGDKQGLENQHALGGAGCFVPTLTASNDPSRSPQSREVTRQVAAVHRTHGTIRRLMPLEFERLQGFPDGYTAIPGAGNGVRYRALGNSFPVPVVKWIGERIQMVEDSK